MLVFALGCAVYDATHGNNNFSDKATAGIALMLFGGMLMQACGFILIGFQGQH